MESLSFFIFLILASCVSSLNFSVESDRRIRSCLLGALKRFHMKHTFPEPITSRSFDTLGLSHFESFPLDLRVNVIENFLNLKSSTSLKLTSTRFAQIPEAFIFRRLANFNPYYLLEDPFVNRLLLKVLDKHFVKSKNLASDFIHDELELLILKFNAGDLDFDLIPRNFYFSIIAFIDETVHGPDSGVPTSQFSVSLRFFQLLKRYKLPESLRFFKENLVFLSNPSEVKPEDVDFLSEEHTKAEIMQRFEFDPLSVRAWIDKNYFLHSVVIDDLVDEVPIEQLMGVCKLLNKIIDGKAIFERFAATQRGGSRDFLEKLILSPHHNYTGSQMICLILKDLFNFQPEKCYFYSRNALNEFSLEEFKAFNFRPNIMKRNLESIISGNFANLYRMELFRVIVESDLIPPQVLNGLLKGSSILLLRTVETSLSAVFCLDADMGVSNSDTDQDEA